MRNEVLAFALAFMTSFGLTPLARHLAFRTGMLDMPGSRKIHVSPMPLLGGLALYAAAVLAFLISLQGSARGQMIGIVAGATLLVLVGLLDDRGLLHHQVKLLGAMPLAAVILIVSGIQGEFPWPLPEPWYSFLSLTLTFFWMVGITAAFSILDHMDGLCAGVAAIASAFSLYFAVVNGQVLVSLLAAAVLGASLGFLPWNFSPARIFLGDGGAMLLGFLVAALGIKLRFLEVPRQVSWMIPVLIVIVPIFDTTLVTVSRLRRGLIPFMSPGKDHTAHRLMNIGLKQREAVLVMYLGGLAGGVLAIVMTKLATSRAFMLAGLVSVFVITLLVLLERAPYEGQKRLDQGDTIGDHPTLVP